MLRNHCPKSEKNVTAFQIMHSPVVTVEGIISTEYLSEILQHDFSMFPVLNSAGNMVGMIPKNFLIVLLKHHNFIDESKLTERQKAKLPRMYRRLSDADELMVNLAEMQNENHFEENFTRRNAAYSAGAKATLTQTDWFL